MAEIFCQTENGIDIVVIQGTLEDEDVPGISAMISNLRQQQSEKLVFDGSGVQRIAVRNWDTLANALKIYRNLGGIVTVAGFCEEHANIIKRAMWYRFVNRFDTRADALAFLDPAGRD